MLAVVSPGGMLRGTAADADRVALVRLEVCPAGECLTRVSEAEVDRAGRYALEVPPGSAPTARGVDCSIAYELRELDRRGTVRDMPGVEVLVEAGPRRASVHEQEPFADRMISRFDARWFHIELADAAVQGGGTVSGRVHANGDRIPEHVAVGCRLQEAWRLDGRGRFHNLNAPPLWHHATLWEERTEVEWREGAHWASFSFDLPEWLPPAVEGRSIAFRYEVEASSRGLLGLRQRAAETPIGYDVVAR
jgi:hypothetical protein